MPNPHPLPADSPADLAAEAKRDIDTLFARPGISMREIDAFNACRRNIDRLAAIASIQASASASPVAEVNNIGMLKATPHGTRVLKAGDQLYTAATQARPASGEAWRPIADAPKDGTAIYVIVADAKRPEAGVAHWNAGWHGGSAEDWEGAEDPMGHFGVYPSPTHWQPLPAAPTSTPSAAKKD